MINGYEQAPIEGESFAAALTDPAAPAKSTQFFTMLGQRAIYHEGWLACTVHPPLSGWSHFEQDEWELCPPGGRPLAVDEPRRPPSRSVSRP